MTDLDIGNVEHLLPDVAERSFEFVIDLDVRRLLRDSLRLGFCTEQDFGRNTHHGRAFRHILEHNRPRTNGGPGADTDFGQNRRVRPDINAFAEFDLRIQHRVRGENATRTNLGFVSNDGTHEDDASLTDRGFGPDGCVVIDNGIVCQLGAERVHLRTDETREGKGAKRSKKQSKAEAGLRFIQKLYVIERQVKDASPEERYRVRQDRSLPILSDLRQWLDESLGAVVPQSLTGKALAYLNGQWPKLVRAFEHGKVPLDTNLVENAIRPFAIGRKNWMCVPRRRYSMIAT